MIEIFINAPIALKVILLSGIVLITITIFFD